MITIKTLPIYLTTIFVCCYAAPRIETTTGNPIQSAMKEIMDLVPKDKVKQIAKEHLKTDEEFKAAVAYMQSPEWTNLIEIIREKEEWKSFKNIVQEELGFDVGIFSKCIEGFVENVSVTVEQNSTAERGLRSFIRDIEQVLPTSKMIEIFFNRIVNTGVFPGILERLKSDHFKDVVTSALSLPEVKQVIHEFDKMGVDIKAILPLLHTFLGWPEFNLD